MEKRYFEYGKNDNTECKHDIAWIESCRQCVFEVLCRLEEIKKQKSYNKKP